jgi:hypothetical protein
MTAILDTSFLFALTDQSDREQQAEYTDYLTSKYQ